MKTFIQLKKNLKLDCSTFKVIKVAVLGDSATQFLVDALRGTAIDIGYNLDVWEADFNQIERQLFDPTSEFYEFKPEVVIVFQSTQKLLSKYNKLAVSEQSLFSETQLKNVENMVSTVLSQLQTKLIYYNHSEIDDSVFGNFANKTPASFLFQLRKINYELMVLGSQISNFHLCDLSSIQNQVGKSGVFQTSIYINTEMVLSIDVLPLIAQKTIDIIAAFYGKFKKCLILDLDNTMWGGIIGDDGIENIQLGELGIGKAFTEFQYWIKKLKNRGIILAVCSKNTDSVAKEPFQKHPDMVLRLEDIAVFVANWENKADNIRYIQSVLNIGFDSMVFLDDNPFERNLVRENIADICVPELPIDPADYLEFLYPLNLFETVSHSKEDGDRTKQYQIEAERIQLQSKFTNEEDFLQSLNMVSDVSAFNAFNTPRVAQLSQRSNQFNLRTVRYGEGEIEKLCNQEGYSTFAFTLEDKFGDNGLICVVILKKETNNTLFIDTWFMSCRVLKRSMENFVLNTIVSFANANGFTVLKGEYIPTAKNEMVKDHYLNLGFEKQNDNWLLSVVNYQKRVNYITIKK